MKNLNQLLHEAGFESLKETERRIEKEKRAKAKREAFDKKFFEETGINLFKGNERNCSLSDIPNDVLVKVTFLVDAIATDDRDDRIKVVGAHHVKIEYNNEMYYIDHIWIRSDKVPSVKKIKKEHVGKFRTMTAKVVTYKRKNKPVKYEFTTL